MTYQNYKVIITDIEWDVGKCPEEDGYDQNVIDNLPKSEEYHVRATDETTAKEWALDDISDNYGFLIQGCKVMVSQC